MLMVTVNMMCYGFLGTLSQADIKKEGYQAIDSQLTEGKDWQNENFGAREEGR